jgi:hypothetical protein
MIIASYQSIIAALALAFGLGVLSNHLIGSYRKLQLAKDRAALAPRPRPADPITMKVDCDNTQALASLAEVRIAAEATVYALAMANSTVPRPGTVIMDSTGCKVCGRPWLIPDMPAVGQS